MATKNATHRINVAGSVQALAIDDDIVFAGLQGGTIVAYSLETYELLASIYAHGESVLGLSLSEDRSLLFSTGADSVVNVWSTQSLLRLYSLHSHHEVGDIFCVAYSKKQETVFWGAQNASISWHHLDSEDVLHPPSSVPESGSRKHRFFDSLGPGGSQNPVYPESVEFATGGQVLTISGSTYKAYAHKSYIYSMVLAKVLLQHGIEEEVLITAGGDGPLKMWSLDTESDLGLVMIHKLKTNDASVLSLAVRGSFLYAGLEDGHTHVYNLASRQLVQRLQVGEGEVSQIQIAPGCLLCGTSQGWVKQFNNQFAEVASWRAQDGKILATALTYSDDNKVFTTGGNDNVVAFWDVRLRTNSSAIDTARSNDDLLDALRQFVMYRTVSGSSKYATDCHEAVTFLRKRCNAFGANTALFSPNEDDVNPILLAKFGDLKNPESRKSILFYGHYDVIDADNSSGNWHADPFALNPLNGFLYGRGVTDDKGPILAAIYAVADLAERNELSCNVTFLIEGDEESGSRGFRRTIQKHHDQIGPVDYILLSNSYWLDDHIPCLTFGMRGVIHATITVTSNQPDLHSGMDGKAVQHEPLKDLTVLLGLLIGHTGTEVMVPGFYDAVDDLTEAEIQSYITIASTLLPGHPEITNPKAFAKSLMQRWRYPNLTVHRIEVPETKVAVTISGTARAALSIRIVPSQTAEQVATDLASFLHATFKEKIRSTNKLHVNITSEANPWLGNIRSDLYSVLQTAITEVWSPSRPPPGSRSFPASRSGTSTPRLQQQQPYANGNSDSSSFAIPDRSMSTTPPPPSEPLTSTTTTSPLTNTTTKSPRPAQRRSSSLASTGTFTGTTTPSTPLFIREGGSIPAISFLEQEFKAPAAMFPMGQASDNAHLDNERMRVENLYKGREVLKKVFGRL